MSAFMRDQAVQWLTAKGHGAGLVVQRAAKTIDQCRLARTVGPDEAQPLALGDGQVDAFERDEPAKTLAQPPDLQERVAAVVGHHASFRRRHDCTSPMRPRGAMMTKKISSSPTISRFSAEEIVTVATCWMVPRRIAPITGPTQLVIPPITGIATLLTA